MKYLFKKFICALLCTSIFACSACSLNSQSDSISETEPSATQNIVDETTQAVKLSTDDQPATYNLSRLKENTDKVTQQFDDFITNKKYKGVVYNKIGGDFEYISQKGLSVVEDHKSNSVNTQYYVGSLTKQFTAVAIMKLVEENKLSLDDKIDKYFENYEYGENITVKNLLTMTSGIPSYTRFAFSDSNYFLLGKIIEKVSEKSYEEYITENIFEPLGMKSSVFDNAENLAIGYDGSDNYKWLYYDGVGYSSSGLITSVSDFLKWIYAFDEYKIISKESVDEMCTPYLENYGYGFFVYQDRIVQTSGFDKYSAMLEFTRSESEIFVSVSNYNYNDPVHLFAMFRVFLKPYYG